MKRVATALAVSIATLCGLASPQAQAVTFRTLYAFKGGADGAEPLGKPLVGHNGLLYGTTLLGGSGGGGTVFSLDPTTGTKTTLYNFTAFGPTGTEPVGALIADNKGTLYGTTEEGGSTAQCSSGCGTVFRLVPSTGVLTTLYTFSGLTDGRLPQGALLFDAAGALYGTTTEGGQTTGNCGSLGCGTVFRLDPKTGVLTTLHGFAPPGDGSYPVAGLVFDTAGVLYGTTTEGSTGSNNGSGTVFKLDPTHNTYAVLHFFDYGVDGNAPSCTLAFQGGALYGTTMSGGPTAATAGTVFRIDPNTGAVTTLHSFLGAPTDGTFPSPGVTPGPPGLLLGTTNQGGSAGAGTIYALNPTTLFYTLVHVFSDGTDGAIPAGGLAVANTGFAYGVTSYGNGTVFSIAQ